VDDQTEREDARRREAYRHAASNLLAFGHEADDPAPPRTAPEPHWEVSHDPTRYGWLCPEHDAATVRTSERTGRRYVGCPECYRFARVATAPSRPAAAGRLAPQAAPLLGFVHRPEPTGCPECSRAVTEAPSAVAAFAQLVVNDTHRREHGWPT
jgi:hypothetical protein